ncbi:response regulator transcription factor [Myroides injenensis]|uniref:response regulator transcription factor n=1 Tax=Myroides injenensis TaxID=1183151 RepID=UPI002270845F|nr:response regulator transcription factor [Myroides injenensis]
MKVKVAIVDDHEHFLNSLELLIKLIPKVEVVLKCSNGQEFIDALDRQRVDVVFLDIQMPIKDGFQTAEELTKYYPKIKIVILTNQIDLFTLSQMFKYNISGYLSKEFDPKELERVILTVKESGVYLDQRIKQEICSLQQELGPCRVNISDRELEIIKLFAKQYSGREIAHKLHISFRTVEKHKELLLQKTDSKNFIGVIMFALRHYYITHQDFYS